MTDERTAKPTLPDLPSHYWSTLAHHGHPSPTKLLLETELSRLSGIHVDSSRHDAAYFSDFSKHERMISPSTRTCSSLLSEMLRPSMDSHVSSPATTHVDTMSDHGSCSQRSSPPLQTSPAKSDTTSHGHDRHLVKSTITLQAAPKPARHISFGGVVAVSKCPTPDLALPISATESDKDFSGDATPVATRHSVYSATEPQRQTMNRTVSTQSEKASSDDQNTATLRPRAIRFAGSSVQTKSVDSSRRSSYSECHIPPKGTDEHHSQSSANGSPVLCSRTNAATCKSTLEAMLKKEQIAKVIETVPEEEDEEGQEGEDDEDEDEDDEDDNYDNYDNDSDEDDGVVLNLELDSDDDGYQEDIESDEDDLFEQAKHAVFDTESGTPTVARLATRGRASGSSEQTILPRISCKMFRPAAPSESDLPDTTDFAPGNMDEDQPACIAFDVAIRDREARRRPAKPSDIDPTFPESGSDDDDSDVQTGANTPSRDIQGRQVCRSPPVQQKILNRLRFNSPPLAKVFESCRARSLPRRFLPSRKCLYAPKPQRAVTIKQSNEQRAQRRREKKEVRHNMRRGTKPEVVDHNGHEKMKVHCLSRRKLVVAENPCVIRPVMSI